MVHELATIHLVLIVWFKKINFWLAGQNVPNTSNSISCSEYLILHWYPQSDLTSLFTGEKISSGGLLKMTVAVDITNTYTCSPSLLYCYIYAGWTPMCIPCQLVHAIIFYQIIINPIYIVSLLSFFSRYISCILVCFENVAEHFSFWEVKINCCYYRGIGRHMSPCYYNHSQKYDLLDLTLFILRGT